MTLLPYITPKCELFYSRHSLKQVVKSYYASCFPFSCVDTFYLGVKLPDASERPTNCDDKLHLREPFCLYLSRVADGLRMTMNSRITRSSSSSTPRKSCCK